MGDQSIQSEMILGVDTHLDTHVGVVTSDTGKLLGTLAVPTDSAGYLKLLTWAKSLGRLRRAGALAGPLVQRRFQPDSTVELNITLRQHPPFALRPEFLARFEQGKAHGLIQLRLAARSIGSNNGRQK